MHYLIDGHNLIGQLEDIDLEDPHDEAKLMLRLKQWAAGNKRRELTVVFDGGLPGGEWRSLSGSKVKAIFASVGQEADDVLIHRIKQAKDPKAFTVVSSDQRVLEAAKKRRMHYIPAGIFASQLHKDIPKEETPVDNSPMTDLPTMSDQEISEWLDIFSKPLSEPDEEPTIRTVPTGNAVQVTNKSADEDNAASPAETDHQSAQLKGGSRRLSQEEVDEWMQLFGGSAQE